jgi:hypothetical protein
MTGKDRKPADPVQRKLDEKLDEALDDTFPASDPPAVTEPAPTLPDDGIETDKKTDKRP